MTHGLGFSTLYALIGLTVISRTRLHSDWSTFLKITQSTQLKILRKKEDKPERAETLNLRTRVERAEDTCRPQQTLAGEEEGNDTISLYKVNSSLCFQILVIFPLFILLFSE